MALDFLRIQRMHEEEEQRKKEINKQENKQRLEKNLQKKFNTTFIGAIDSFEKAFGYLWKHGTPWNELTENEKRFRELWNDTRNEVLNKGNAQLRAAMNELSEYTTVWNRKNYEFKIEKEQSYE